VKGNWTISGALIRMHLSHTFTGLFVILGVITFFLGPLKYSLKTKTLLLLLPCSPSLSSVQILQLRVLRVCACVHYARRQPNPELIATSMRCIWGRTMSLSPHRITLSAFSDPATVTMCRMEGLTIHHW